MNMFICIDKYVDNYTTGECYILVRKLAVGTDMSFKLHLASTFCIPDVSVQEISPIVIHAARCTRSHHLTYSYHFFKITNKSRAWKVC